MILKTVRTILITVIIFAVFNFFLDINSDTFSLINVITSVAKTASVVMFDHDTVF